MIEFNKINKSYHISKRQAGVGHAVKALFSRQYETIHALQEVSFQIKDGEMVSYIGPNGAGKSTTIKIMCGILTPDSGECRINGRIPWKDRVAHVREIGVVFGQRSQLWWDVPVLDSFELIRDMYKVENRQYKKNMEELVELLNLSELLKTPTRNLSLGQRMRCELAASLLHNPKTLFLDEPTIGLDAVSKIAVRQFIQKLNKERGTTMILTTHDMQDVEALTERILLIGKGRLLLDGGIEELRQHVCDHKNMIVKYKGAQPGICDGMVITEQKEDQFTIAVNPQVLSVSDAITYLASESELLDVSVTDITAEEMVVALYKEYGI